ncbi:MAG: DUF3015 family protein [Salinisphaera sp.]|uniref:DUF3015 family protein n=1 Tax=Salinisphaera sp. TaxID=1914330 RepID=UPI003C7C629C
MSKSLGLATAASTLIFLAGCAAVTSTTNTTADALHTVSHGVSVSSRSSTNASRGNPQSARAARTRAYVSIEMSQLRREAAVGGGEHIQALAELMGRNQGNRTLGPWMQQHYDTLFATPRSPAAFIRTLKSAQS